MKKRAWVNVYNDCKHSFFCLANGWISDYYHCCYCRLSFKKKGEGITLLSFVNL